MANLIFLALYPRGSNVAHHLFGHQRLSGGYARLDTTDILKRLKVLTSIAGIVLYRLYCYQAGFSTLLSNSSTTKSRFIRLFMISIILIFVVLPISIQALVVPLEEGYHSYDWNYTHYVGWDIIKVPTGGKILAHEIDAIIGIVSGYLVFFCFGLGKDAIGMYRAWAAKLGLLTIFPCLKERTPHLGQSITSSVASRQITVTTTRESKSEPYVPLSMSEIDHGI
jgi:pheromone a factor receptor